MAITVAPSLHIAYKGWAYEPRTFAHCRENLRATQRWANDLHCLGGEFADGNPGLHFPYLDEITTDLDGGRLEQDYLALERFANATCTGLHIPYKEWLRLNPDDTYGPRKEQANLLAVERWAARVGRCCAPSFVPVIGRWYVGSEAGGDISYGQPPNYEVVSGIVTETLGPFDLASHIEALTLSFLAVFIHPTGHISIMKRHGAGLFVEVSGHDWDYTMGLPILWHEDIHLVPGDEVRLEIDAVGLSDPGTTTLSTSIRFSAGPVSALAEHLTPLGFYAAHTYRRWQDPTVERWNVFDRAEVLQLADTEQPLPNSYTVIAGGHSQTVTVDVASTAAALSYGYGPGIGLGTGHMAFMKWDGAAWVEIAGQDFSPGSGAGVFRIDTDLVAGDQVRVEVTSGSAPDFYYKLYMWTYAPLVTTLPDHHPGVGYERYTLRPWVP